MAAKPCICLDIGGTLLSGVMGPELPGALNAVDALRAAGYPVRFVTNTTSVTVRKQLSYLREVGLLHEDIELYTPLTTARRALTQRGATSGILIATPEQKAELTWFEERVGGQTVLLATEAHDFTIAQLQPAFRSLLEGAQLYALEVNRYFTRDNQLLTDVGAVAAFLEYAANTEAEVLGKPSQLLFETIAQEVGRPLEELVMVGDDAEFDVAQPGTLGVLGILIRTGKYRRGDEDRFLPAPAVTLDSMADVPGWLDAQALTAK